MDDGKALIASFCTVNNIGCPPVVQYPADAWPFDACAYYRPTQINICVPKCAAIGTVGRAWSYPGHIIDRTPYGVLAHELGHHIDVLNSTTVDRYRGNFSVELRRQANEPKLTNYCPDDGEWAAEMLRLFITNPDLLRAIRPRTHAALIKRGLKPVHTDGWRSRLAGAPERTIALCARRVDEAATLSPKGSSNG
ncbi:hypothetical protein [Azospirillum sp.]|uniref:hypothetical protein n=1 Tax=Azospirillum sp. TaxID=34012 RepID=UPI003D729FA8